MKRRWPHEDVYSRIGASLIHGAGVLTIRAIPAGTLEFQVENERVAWVSRDSVRRLPAAIRSLYEDFGMVHGDKIGVPPTLDFVHCDESQGEELAADYRTIVDEKLPFRPKR